MWSLQSGHYRVLKSELKDLADGKIPKIIRSLRPGGRNGNTKAMRRQPAGIRRRGKTLGPRRRGGGGGHRTVAVNPIRRRSMKRDGRTAGTTFNGISLNANADNLGIRYTASVYQADQIDFATGARGWTKAGPTLEDTRGLRDVAARWKLNFNRSGQFYGI